MKNTFYNVKRVENALKPLWWYNCSNTTTEKHISITWSNCDIVCLIWSWNSCDTLSIIKQISVKNVSLINIVPARYLTAQKQCVWPPGYISALSPLLSSMSTAMTLLLWSAFHCSIVQCCRTMPHITLEYSTFPRGQLARSSMTSMTSLLRRLPRGGRDRHRRRKGEQDKVREVLQTQANHLVAVYKKDVHFRDWIDQTFRLLRWSQE